MYSAAVPSDFLDFLTDNDRVVATNLFGAQLAIVERTLVFVRISVHGTVEATTTTLETYTRRKFG